MVVPACQIQCIAIHSCAFHPRSHRTMGDQYHTYRLAYTEYFYLSILHLYACMNVYAQYLYNLYAYQTIPDHVYLLVICVL